MRRISGIVTAGVLLVMLAGCVGGVPDESTATQQQSSSPGNAPTSQGAAPASGLEETSIAKAKSVVVEYARAIGLVVVSDPSTRDPANSLSTAAHIADNAAFYDEFANLGWTITGAPKVTLLEVVPDDSTSESIVFRGCLDSTGVIYRDGNGIAKRSPDAIDYPSVTVHLRSDEATGEWLIDKFVPREGEPKC